MKSMNYDAKKKMSTQNDKKHISKQQEEYYSDEDETPKENKRGY